MAYTLVPRQPAFAPPGICPWCGSPKAGRGHFCRGHWRRWWEFWYGDPPGHVIVVLARDGFRCQLCQQELDWTPQPFWQWLKVKLPNVPLERQLPRNGYEVKYLRQMAVTWRREQWREVRARLHIDHIVAVSNGGPHTLDNMRTLCKKCNLGRGNRDESWELVRVRRDKARLEVWTRNATA